LELKVLKVFRAIRDLLVLLALKDSKVSNEVQEHQQVLPIRFNLIIVVLSVVLLMLE
jgi:hypothetical protein